MTRALAPLAMAGSVLCFAAAALVPGVITAQQAEAAPKPRFVQIVSGGTSVGVYVIGNRLQCISAVAGKRPASVTVAVGSGVPLVKNRLLRARQESGCMKVNRPPGTWTFVPDRAYMYMTTTTGGPVTRTLLP